MSDETENEIDEKEDGDEKAVADRFMRSPETELVLHALLEKKDGEILLWDDAARLAGVERRKVRAIVYRARLIAEREYGTVFWAIEGEGVMRLSPQDVINVVPEDARKRAVAGARRTKRRLLTIKNLDALSPEDRAKWNSGLALAAVTEHVASAKVAQKVLVAIDNKSTFELATSALLDMLKPKKKE